MPPSSSSVVAALRDLGLRNAGTPLLIASTPVSAAQPWVNARSTRNAQRQPGEGVALGSSSRSALGARVVAEQQMRVEPPADHPEIPIMNA